MEDKPKSRRWLKVVVVFLLLLFLGTGGVALGAWYIYSTGPLPMVPETDEVVTIEVKPGWGTAQIAKVLEDEGLVRYEWLFRLGARQKELDGKLKAGEYELSPGMSMWDIMEKLARGEVVQYRVTVPEGLTVEQTVAVLAKHEFFEEEKLWEAIERETETWPHINDEYREQAEFPLEGYLYPETYTFPRGTSESDIVRHMLDAFERVFDQTYRERALELGYSIHEIVTLASVIEKEAMVAAERETISGVYHNRLNIGMKLDADPTVRYALKKYDGIVLYVDLEVDSPYNTYRNAGLPPGPIAAPGKGSIEAALYPADVPYFYFVAKSDGSGEHVFSRTLSEHNANVREQR